jgi:hypothetical protein
MDVVTTQFQFPFRHKTRGVSHYGLASYIEKYLKAKEEELVGRFWDLEWR